MTNLILFAITGIIVESILLLIIAISLVKLSKNETHPGILFSFFFTAILFILYIAYLIILFGLERMGLGDDVFYGGVFGVYGDISSNIWFYIGSYAINYSIMKGTMTLISGSGVFLGIIRFIIGIFQKL